MLGVGIRQRPSAEVPSAFFLSTRRTGTLYNVKMEWFVSRILSHFQIVRRPERRHSTLDTDNAMQCKGTEHHAIKELTQHKYAFWHKYSQQDAHEQ